MRMDFDKPLDRRHKNCVKWDVFECDYDFATQEGRMPLWVADMDFECAPELATAVRKAVELPAYGYFTKTPEYRAAICSWYQKRFGFEVAPTDLTLGHGVVQFVMAAVQAFTRRGEGVIIMTPVYDPFHHVINANERVLVNNPLVETYANGYLHYDIDFDLLETQAADPNNTLLILCSPHNPLGRVWTVEEMRRVADICKKHGVFVFSDEIHQDLVLEGAPHTPFLKACPDMAEHAFSAASASKSFNIAGLDAAYAVFKAESPKKAVEHVFHVNVNVESGYLSDAALRAAYTEAGYYADELCEYLRGNLEFIRKFFSENLPEARLSAHTSTYLQFIDMRSCMNVEPARIYDIMKEHAGVVLMRGEWYGYEKAYTGYLRLNFASPRSMIEVALNRIKKTVDAVNRGEIQ